jgi:hypothetical protein
VPISTSVAAASARPWETTSGTSSTACPPAWREHGPRIATSLRPDDLGRIAHVFARLNDFDRAISALPIRRLGILTEGAPRPIQFSEGMREKVKEIAALTGTALGLLETLAPRELQPPPPQAGQRRVWPPATLPPL